MNTQYRHRDNAARTCTAAEALATEVNTPFGNGYGTRSVLAAVFAVLTDSQQDGVLQALGWAPTTTEAPKSAPPVRLDVGGQWFHVCPVDTPRGGQPKGVPLGFRCPSCLGAQFDGQEGRTVPECAQCNDAGVILFAGGTTSCPTCKGG